ncbi:MAG: hypothetical protein KBD25_01255 [Rickettsiaceae bacterium]|nr:hypothetical protein [Rickettsiaceae bacterium]
MKDSELIDKMEQIRSNNNRNWMDLVRLAIKLDPITTKSIIKEIVEHDRKIAGVLEELSQ